MNRERLDHYWMGRALELAYTGVEAGFRPFGCVVVSDAGRVGAGFGSEIPADPTRHSEMLAIKEATRHREGLLEDCTLYSTHEPCVMCIGAINHAKIGRVVFGSYRSDLSPLFRNRRLGYACMFRDTSAPPEVRAGVRRAACVALFAEELKEIELQKGYLRLLARQRELLG